MTRYNLCLLSGLLRHLCGLLRHLFLKTADIRVHILGNRSRRGPKSFSNRGHRGWPFGRPVLGPPLDRVRSVPYMVVSRTEDREGPNLSTARAFCCGRSPMLIGCSYAGCFGDRALSRALSAAICLVSGRSFRLLKECSPTILVGHLSPSSSSV